MIRIVDGIATIALDDARISPDMARMRDYMNDFLRWLATDGLDKRRLREQYRTGRIAESGFDWFCDPSLPSSPEPRPSNPVHTADVSLGSRAVGASPQGSDAGSGTRGL